MMKFSWPIRALLAALSGAFLAAPAAAWPVRGAAPLSYFNGGGIQINTNIASYYTGMHQYMNHLSAGGVIEIVSSIHGTITGKAAWDAVGASGQPYFDPATGELNVPVQTDVTAYRRGVFQPPSKSNRVPNGIYGPPNVGISGPQGKWWLGQVWNFEWTGTLSTAGTKFSTGGDPGTGGAVGYGTPGGCGSNCVTVTFGDTTDPTNFAPGFVIDASNRNDPPRYANFYQSQYVTQARSADLATRLINPDWLAQWGVAGKSGVGKIRFMDEVSANNNAATDFSQLAEHTFSSFSQQNSFSGGNLGNVYPVGYNGDYGPKGGIGPQTVCVVANKLGASPHWTFPYAFTTAAAFQTGQAFDGCLNAGLPLDAEYCNEIWNFGAGFACYRYNRRQPYPPIGPSAPYQQAVTITSITPGNPTTINVASNPYANLTNVAFSIPGLNTIATALDAGSTNAQGPFAVGGSTGTSFTVPVNTTGLSYTSGGTVYLVDGGATTHGGYRAAVLMNQLYSAYGPSKRSRWRGILGGQLTGTAEALQAAITGAMFFINNESSGSGPCAPRLCLSDLFDEGQLAPYAGNSAYNGIAITALNQSATPTATAPGHTFTNGQTIRLYATTGMTQINNLPATVSGVSGNNFNINIDTSTFTAWAAGNGNFAIDNALPKAADDSIALNISTPGTYPTKYSYFAEQMSDATINGTSVSNPSFGYVVGSSGNYRSFASCGSSCIPGIMLANALVAKRYGLKFGEYEAAKWSTYIETNGQTNLRTTGNSAIEQLFDFVSNWQYDAGTATKGPADIETAHIAAGQAAGVAFPSIYSNVGPGPNTFNATRYFGDAPAGIQRMYTQNAAGPYVEPYTPPAWTVYYPGNQNRKYTAGSCNPCTDTLTTVEYGPGATRVHMTVAFTGGTVPSVTCDGVTPASPVATSTSGGRSVWIYNMAVGAGSNPRTCSITSTANFQDREFYVFTTTGLQSNTPVATQPGNPASSFTLNYTGGDLIVAASACSVASGPYAGTSGMSTPTAANPIGTILASDSDSAHNAMFALMFAPFSSPLFSLAPGCNQAVAAAVYR